MATGIRSLVPSLQTVNRGSESNSGTGEWTWKHVALGAAGVLLIGVSSYGIYSVLFKSDSAAARGSKAKQNKSKKSTPRSEAEETSTDSSVQKVCTCNFTNLTPRNISERTDQTDFSAFILMHNPKTCSFVTAFDIKQ